MPHSCIMRLKVRLDSDKPGLWAWLASWFTNTPAPGKSATPEGDETAELPVLDHRWENFPGVNGVDWRVLAAGRNTRNSETGVESEYIFRAVDSKQTHEFRVLLPEKLVNLWERTSGRRMTEAERLEAVKKRLERMLAEGGPDRGVVDELG